MKKKYVVYWEARYKEKRYLRSIKSRCAGYCLSDYNFDKDKSKGFGFSDYITADLHAGHLSAISHNDFYCFGIEEV